MTSFYLFIKKGLYVVIHVATGREGGVCKFWIYWLGVNTECEIIMQY